MGMKKELLFRALWFVLGKTRRDPRWAKKLVGLAVVSGLLVMAGGGVLLYFAVGMAKDLIVAKPDLDLLALERLSAEKALVLSEEQQRLLTPIIDSLAVSGLTPEQVSALQAQLRQSISPAQLAMITEWKAAASTEAAGLWALLPPAVGAIIEEYRALAQELVGARIKAILAWWQLTKPENNAEQLQKDIRSL